jgi:hypothetical protein
MQLFADLCAKMIVVPKLKDNKQERTREVYESRKSAHNLLNKNEHNNYVRTVCTEQAGRPEGTSDLTHSFHKGSVNLLSLHPSRRRAVAAQPDAGIERGLKTHQVSGLLP